jgi:hypothetical protein
MALQLSIFVENKPGKLDKITNLLAEKGISIRGFSIANAGDFGIIKIIVDNPEMAFNILKENHIAVSKKNIIAVRISDKPGSLRNLLAILTKNNINLEDCYGISIAYNSSAAIILEVEKSPEAQNILSDNGITLLTDNEIYSI